MTAAGAQSPYRVVDRFDQGWHTTFDDAGAVVYAADYGFKRDLADRSLADIERDRGPVRPVLPPTDEDVAEIRAVLDRVRRKAVATIAAALEEVFDRAREEHGGLAGAGSYDAARRRLMAGREGSWEAEALMDLVLSGNGFNLVRPKGVRYPTVEQMRAAGPSSRVDAAGRAELVAVFTRWTSSPDRYTEVAENLAAIVSRYADETAGADGWRRIADQWLQPDALIRSDDFVPCYRLLYSLSAHLSTELF